MATTNKSQIMELKFNPESLVLARDFEGMTQTALAKILKVSQGKVSKMEDGILAVTMDTISELADIFSRPRSFFVNDWKQTGMEGFYRKKCSLPQKAQRKAHALMNIERLQFQALDKVHKFVPRLPYLDPDEHLGGAVEIARKMRQHLGVPDGAIANLTQIVEQAGCIVRYIDYGTLKIDGYSVFNENHTPIIFLNRAFPSDRRRLTLAHEFGHIIMHRESRPNMESEAYDFAGEFLMPEREIKHTMYPLTVDKLARMKLKWGVSMAAILKHGERIGAVKERYYRYLYMQLGKSGYRTTEPYSDKIAKEPATKITRMMAYMKNKMELSDEDLRNIMCIDESDLTKLQAEDNGHRFTVV